MQLRIALAVTFLMAAYGCATEPEPKQAGAAAPAAAPTQPQSSRAYRTGSRLPSMEEDTGSSSVGGMSKDDYMDDRNRGGASGVRGN